MVTKKKKKRIENLEAKFKELQCRFCIVEVGVSNKLTKIEEKINKLIDTLLFNQASEASNNSVLVFFKSHRKRTKKENHDNFEGEKPQFASQLAKLESYRLCGNDPNIWRTRVEQFFDYKVVKPRENLFF